MYSFIHIEIVFAKKRMPVEMEIFTEIHTLKPTDSTGNLRVVLL